MAETSVSEIKSHDEFKEIINGVKPAVIDFYADWCGPCKFISPKFAELAALKGNQGIGFYKVDVDAQTEIAQEVGIRAMPTFVLYKPDEPNEVQAKGSQTVLGAKLPEIQALITHAGGVTSD